MEKYLQVLLYKIQLVNFVVDSTCKIFDRKAVLKDNEQRNYESKMDTSSVVVKPIVISKFLVSKLLLEILYLPLK